MEQRGSTIASQGVEKIIIIDDEVDLGELIKAILEPHFGQVLYYSNPQEALSEIKKGDTTLILSDIKMPGLSGAELVTHVRGMGLLQPIVFLSGYVDREVALLALRLGVQDVLEKPFIEEAVVLTLRKVIDMERRREKLYRDIWNPQTTEESLQKQKKMMGLMLVSNTKKADFRE